MKTEQEQIKEIAELLCDKLYGCICRDDGEICNHRCEDYERAEALVQAGYGNVSEYKAKIEQLKKGTSDIRKGTAKEILQTLYDKCYEINDETGESMGNFVSDDDILCLAKHYGVEVDV